MRTKSTQFATIIILLTSILLSPVTLVAQTAISDWSRLNSVPTETKLSVKLKNGATIDGKFSGVSDTALTLMVKKSAKEVRRNDVLSVHQVTRKSAKAATLIGAGVGAGAGALFGAVSDATNDDDFVRGSVVTGVTTVLGAGVGALSGFLIGRTAKKRILLYEAK